MQTSLVVDEGGRRRGNAGDASRYRPEGVHSLDASRFIGVSFYGAVTVNSWTGFIFASGTPPWGAHPSSTPVDIQSGNAWVHSALMLEGVEKAVLRHPLTIVPKPATFPSHRTAHTLMRRMTSLEGRPSWLKIPGIVAAAMRG